MFRLRRRFWTTTAPDAELVKVFFSPASLAGVSKVRKRTVITPKATEGKDATERGLPFLAKLSDNPRRRRGTSRGASNRAQLAVPDGNANHHKPNESNAEIPDKRFSFTGHASIGRFRSCNKHAKGRTQKASCLSLLPPGSRKEGAHQTMGKSLRRARSLGSDACASYYCARGRILTTLPLGALNTLPVSDAPVRQRAVAPPAKWTARTGIQKRWRPIRAFVQRPFQRCARAPQRTSGERTVPPLGRLGSFLRRSRRFPFAASPRTAFWTSRRLGRDF